MARPGLRDNPKFRRLVHLTKLPRPYVWGLLESLWAVGYDSGNPVIGDKVDIELAAEYPEMDGKFAEALIECRLVDKVKESSAEKYQIHDLFENAPEYVKKRQLRIAEQKTSVAERRTLSAERRTTADNGGDCPPNGRTPRPAPPRTGRMGVLEPKFERTPEWIAQVWTNLTTRRFNGCPAERLEDAVPGFAELIRLGHDPAEILKAIEDPARNRNERLDWFLARIAKGGKSEDPVAYSKRIDADMKARRAETEKRKAAKEAEHGTSSGPAT